MADNNTLLVWDTDEEAPPGYPDVVYWQGKGISERKISISQLVEENSGHLRSAFLGLIYELGETLVEGKRIVDHLEIRPGFSFWWMTALVEKVNYIKTSQIDNIVKLIAFRGWLIKRDCSEISVVTSNEELADAIQLLAVEFGLAFSWKKVEKIKRSGSLVRRIYSHLSEPVRGLIWLTRHLITRWPLRGVGLDSWRNSQATISVASYLFNLDSGSAQKGVFKSNYWGHLPEMLCSEGVQTNWIHLFIEGEQKGSTKTARNLILKFNQAHANSQNHVLLDSFISIGVVWKVVQDWRQTVKLKKLLEGGVRDASGYVWPLLVSDFCNSMEGPAAASKLLSLALFEKAMFHLPPQKKGLYLQENLSWETAFMHAWRSMGHGQELMGIPHSTIRYWDLRYHFDPRSYASTGLGMVPLPDHICINGEEEKSRLLESGYPLGRMIEVEALRFLYLCEASSRGVPRNAGQIGDRTLLIVGGYSLENTKTQMELLQDAVKYIEKEIRFLVKPHPACAIDARDYPELDLEVVSDPVSRLIDHCDLVYSSNVTSAAVDAYCMGKQVVTILDLTCLNMSPLRGREGVSFVVTPEELATVLDGIDISKDAGVAGADFFYLDERLLRWRKLLIDEIRN